MIYPTPSPFGALILSRRPSRRCFDSTIHTTGPRRFTSHRPPQRLGTLWVEPIVGTKRRQQAGSIHVYNVVHLTRRVWEGVVQTNLCCTKSNVCTLEMGIIGVGTRPKTEAVLRLHLQKRVICAFASHRIRRPGSVSRGGRGIRPRPARYGRRRARRKRHRWPTSGAAVPALAAPPIVTVTLARVAPRRGHRRGHRRAVVAPSHARVRVEPSWRAARRLEGRRRRRRTLGRLMGDAS